MRPFLSLCSVQHTTSLLPLIILQLLNKYLDILFTALSLTLCYSTQLFGLYHNPTDLNKGQICLVFRSLLENWVRYLGHENLNSWTGLNPINKKVRKFQELQPNLCSSEIGSLSKIPKICPACYTKKSGQLLLFSRKIGGFKIFWLFEKNKDLRFLVGRIKSWIYKSLVFEWSHHFRSNWN